jgi:POT family proton-dependent oligopeptide transporter
MSSTASGRQWFGHPRGLATLFFTEMWERFSYYGMRAILVLYIMASTATGGLGMTAAEAGMIYAMYTSLVYLLSVPGGWLADNYLGLRRAVFLGGFIIMCGHICLAMPSLGTFYAGLGLVALGTGLLKPNISATVGALYAPQDLRRDAGFSIYYMGINLGAFTAPLVCGWLAQGEWFREFLGRAGLDPRSSWHFGFGAAAVGMALGLVQYVLTGRHLGDAGRRPAPVRDAADAAHRRRVLALGAAFAAVLVAAVAGLALTNPAALNKENINAAYTVFLLVVVVAFFARLFTGKWTPAERNRLYVIGILFVAAAVFWSVFEQAGSTLTLIAEELTDNRVFGWEFPSSFWQSANSLFVITLAPLFTWLWLRLGPRNPGYAAKFGWGLLLAAAGFLWLALGARGADGENRMGVQWLLTTYLLHTMGEMCLSPVGLSAMTRLAPQRVVGQMLGVWFLAASVGNFLSGMVATYYERFAATTILAVVAAGTLGVAALMFALVQPVKKMLEEKAAK